MGMNEMSASAASAAIRRGEIGSEALVRACLERIAGVEERIQAWTYLDPNHALAQAREADRRQRSGASLPPLHGVPVGIKDVFDTADMPTENGTLLHAGRRPREDATAVALLRAAGAIIVGKTVTTELAVYAPGKTTNPHDPRRTPGGSSSGSAAAVAASMVPFALGTQTNGSVIRPASYCGVYGFKPSHGSISRHGVLAQSRMLDHVGMFARTVEDIALIARPLFACDGKDRDVARDVRLDLRDGWELEPLAPPRIAFVKTPLWENATDTAKLGFAMLTDQWRGIVREVELPPLFASAIEWHRTIMESDLAVSFAAEYARGKAQLSDALREMIERGQRHNCADYAKAQEGVSALNRELDRIFSSFDAILTPATTGEAPIGLASTGSPMFCTIWTLCGVPSISLPILQGDGGMPIGAQLVAAKGHDARLLRIARWLSHPDRTASDV
jgi:Asp-tRNA(Asn)/Glu-tRNA(Gln) amidotransferase A subunit family amidase